jgi:hypothetical protein
MAAKDLGGRAALASRPPGSFAAMLSASWDSSLGSG